jgi:hypothetical protein
LLDFDDSRRQFQELHLAASVNNTRAVYLFLCVGFPGETIRVATRGLATADSYTPSGLLTLYSELTDKIECVRILLGISILSPLSNSVVAAIEKPSTHLFSLAACYGRISPLRLFEIESLSMFQEIWLRLVRLSMPGDHTDTVF